MMYVMCAPNWPTGCVQGPIMVGTVVLWYVCVMGGVGGTMHMK